MDKTIKVLSASVMAGMFAFSSVASAETASFNAGVTVQNAFTLTKDADLDFGTIRAQADTVGTNASSMVLSADPNAAQAAPTVGASNTNLAILVPGAPGAFSVSGVSPFAALDIAENSGNTTISAAAAPPGTANFTVGTFTFYVTSGPNVGAYAAAGDLQADASGAVSFNVGATLTTDATTPSADYIDGAYAGSFQIEVTYN